MKKLDKDDFMLGLQNELNDSGIKCVYMRRSLWDYDKHKDLFVHQIRVGGLVCRSMYITYLPDKKEIHVSDQMHFRRSTKDWEFVLVDPISNPQLIVNFFKDLKAVADKYGRSV